jgi:hypothetical protein
MQLIQSGNSYLSQNDKRLHFGLGENETAERVQVTWPDGTSTVLENLKAYQFLVIRQENK